MKLCNVVLSFYDANTETTVTCTRNENLSWSISGPVYPRILALLAYISTWAKEYDKTPRP